MHLIVLITPLNLNFPCHYFGPIYKIPSLSLSFFLISQFLDSFHAINKSGLHKMQMGQEMSKPIRQSVYTHLIFQNQKKMKSAVYRLFDSYLS